MSLFARRRGRHADLGNFTGWGGLARYAAAAAAHPVVDARISRPVSARTALKTSQENR